MTCHPPSTMNVAGLGLYQVCSSLALQTAGDRPWCLLHRVRSRARFAAGSSLSRYLQHQSLTANHPLQAPSRSDPSPVNRNLGTSPGTCLLPGNPFRQAHPCVGASEAGAQRDGEIAIRHRSPTVRGMGRACPQSAGMDAGPAETNQHARCFRVSMTPGDGVPESSTAPASSVPKEADGPLPSRCRDGFAGRIPPHRPTCLGSDRYGHGRSVPYRFRRAGTIARLAPWHGARHAAWLPVSARRRYTTPLTIKAASAGTQRTGCLWGDRVQPVVPLVPGHGLAGAQLGCNRLHRERAAAAGSGAVGIN